MVRTYSCTAILTHTRGIERNGKQIFRHALKHKLDAQSLAQVFGLSSMQTYTLRTHSHAVPGWLETDC